MPSGPDQVYKHDGWQGYGHWLGTGTVATKDWKFLPFKTALLHARSLKLNTAYEWRAFCKTGALPANVPSNPRAVYRQEGWQWQGYGHWLGTGNLHSKAFLPFKRALVYARTLKLKTSKTPLKDWREWCKSGARPANVPPIPHKTYKHEGWQGYGHWLGFTVDAGVEVLKSLVLDFELTQDN